MIVHVHYWKIIHEGDCRFITLDSKGVELYAIIAASRYMVCSAQNDFCTI